MRPSVLRACALVALLLVPLAACAPADEPAGTTTTGPGSSAPAAAACSPDSLATLEPGTLTVATDEPAFEPWVVGDDPASGEGFEAAVAYAVAEELGYQRDSVTWTRVPFNAAIQPGPKDFDFDINQFSITDERRQAVDFSSGYYDVRQAVVALAGSPAVGAAGLADLRDVRFGAQVATTSYDAIVEQIRPNQEPSVFNSNDDAKLALQNGQVDAIVVDLPTAFFITAAELENGVIVGQLPAGSDAEQFGLLLELGSPLTECVTRAVDALREDGTLAELEQRWLADTAGAPELR